MPDQAEPAADKPTKRPDDRRGAPAGRWGNVAHQHDPEIAAKVRQFASRFPVNGEHFIAAKCGISRDTLRKYYADEVLEARADMLAAVAGQVIARALDAGTDGVKGDLDAQKFILARLGGWSTKLEVGDRAAQPFGGPAPDLSRLTDEQLEEYGRLAAIAEGQDPDEVVGSSPD